MVAVVLLPLLPRMFLLAAVVYPQMSWRLAIGLVIVALAPFAKPCLTPIYDQRPSR